MFWRKIENHTVASESESANIRARDVVDTGRLSFEFRR
jgi:hypothetical protein